HYTSSPPPPTHLLPLPRPWPSTHTCLGLALRVSIPQNSPRELRQTASAFCARGTDSEFYLRARRCFPSASSVRPWDHFVLIIPLILYLLLPFSVPAPPFRPRPRTVYNAGCGHVHGCLSWMCLMLFGLTVTVQLRALALYGAPRAGHALAPRSPVRPPTVTHVLRGRARLFPPARCVGSAHIVIRGPSSGPRLLVAPPCLLAEPPYPHCAAPPAGYAATPSLCPPSSPSYRPSYRPVRSSRRALDAGCPYRRCPHLRSLRSVPLRPTRPCVPQRDRSLPHSLRPRTAPSSRAALLTCCAIPRAIFVRLPAHYAP
ncbi:hypothetical protein B0H11DRAFT_1161271, partial [Mycena galericulata]